MPGPSSVIPGLDRASHHNMETKGYIYHMPFYRVIQKYKELGVKISDSTMNDWYAATCEKLKLLYDILYREVLSRAYIQVD